MVIICVIEPFWIQRVSDVTFVDEALGTGRQVLQAVQILKLYLGRAKPLVDGQRLGPLHAVQDGLET